MSPRRVVHSLQELSDQAEGWVRARLWAQVVVGLVLGVFVGYLIRPDVRVQTLVRGTPGAGADGTVDGDRL